METYTTLGALMLQNELTLLEIITALGFFGGMILILVQVAWLDQIQILGKDLSQAELESRRSFQRISFPGIVQAAIPSHGVKFHGTIWNISRSGIGIVAPKWLRKGSVISLGISWFGLTRELYETQVEGRVAFCLNGGQFSILGIAFNEVVTEAHPHLFRTISVLEAE